MTDFQIVPAKQWHCGQITRLMRSEHRAAIVALGPFV
jgi:hypothetical protein